MVEILKVDKLDEARAEIKKVGSSGHGTELMAPKMLHFNIKVSDLDVRAANIIKILMLAVNGDAAIHGDVFDWKTQKSDAIIMGNLKQIRQLVDRLEGEPYGLAEVRQSLQELVEQYK